MSLLQRYLVTEMFLYIVFIEQKQVSQKYITVLKRQLSKLLLVLTISKFLILTHEIVWDCVKAFLGSVLLICIIKLTFMYFLSSKRSQSPSQT